MRPEKKNEDGRLLKNPSISEALALPLSFGSLSESELVPRLFL